MPGLLLSALYVLYLLGLGIWRPILVPAVPKEERAAVSAAQLAGKIVRVVAPPIGLVLCGARLNHRRHCGALGSAAMGALGSIAVAAIGRRLTVQVLRETCQATTRISAMVLFILICAQAFSLAFRGLHGEALVQDAFRFPAGRHQCQHLVPDAADLRSWILHRVDRDFLYCSAAVPAGLHRRQRRSGLAGDPDCVNLQLRF